MSVYSENGKTRTEIFVKPKYDATPVADTLGNQLRSNIGFLDASKTNNTTIGIEMRNEKNGGTIIYGRDALVYEKFDRAAVNAKGPFLAVAKFGDYSGRAGRALAILHEIAHMILTKGSDRMIVNDGGEENREKSVENTKIIQAKCKKELDALN